MTNDNSPLPKRHKMNVFASSDTLAEALAAKVAAVLSEALESRDTALLAVSGGTTPARFFAALSRQKLDWSRVTVTLVDERFVPESSPRSNAALVRGKLLVNEAAAARFVGLYHPEETVEAAAGAAARALARLPLPLDVAILGMGTDGHTASFFPDAGNLGALLDPASPELVLPVHAPSAGEPRLTLSLPRLLEARFVALHIEGQEKQTVLDEALRPGSTLPISAVFTNTHTPVPVYWAG